jgi:hypothetical protein
MSRALRSETTAAVLRGPGRGPGGPQQRSSGREVIACPAPRCTMSIDPSRLDVPGGLEQGAQTCAEPGVGNLALGRRSSESRTPAGCTGGDHYRGLAQPEVRGESSMSPRAYPAWSGANRPDLAGSDSSEAIGLGRS